MKDDATVAEVDDFVKQCIDLGRYDEDEVSRLAHNMGRTAFLFPEGAIFPLSGFPPCTIKSAIRRGRAETQFTRTDFQRQYSRLLPR